MHITKNQAGCTDTVFIELTRETAVKAGKTFPKPLNFYTLAFTKSCRHKKYWREKKKKKKEIKLPDAFWKESW